MLGTVATVLFQDHEIRHTEFQQLPYHRIFIMLLVELNQPEPILEAINFQVLQTFRYVSHLILCAVILWWFQKVVTTDFNLGVALCGRYIRDDTWKLCVLLSARGVVRDIDTSISCSYAWYCLRKCLLHIKCSALRDFFTLGSRVFYFSYFFFHACAGSFGVSRHLFGSNAAAVGGAWNVSGTQNTNFLFIHWKLRKEIREKKRLSFNL